MDIGIEQVHRLSLDQYHRLIEAGGFDDDARVELIEGVLVDIGPRTAEHDKAIRWLARWLISHTEADRHDVGVGTALTLERSEPEPDLSVIPRDATKPYHPGTAALVIEVSVSSLRYDVLVKSAVYAFADVPEYWVVDLAGRRIVCHRHPGSDGVYREVHDVREDERLVAASVDLPPLDVGQLLAAADA